MCPRRRRVEHDLDVVKVGHRGKAVDALVGDGNSYPPRASQPIGVGVDTDHRWDLEILGGAQNLDHQIGPDIAGSDDGHFGFRHDRSLRENVADTSPSGAISARIRVPGGVATIGPRAPDKMTCPARSGSPNDAAVRANHANALSGSPRHAEPDPSETRLSLTYMRIVALRGSKSQRLNRLLPRTNTPLEALSATVSVIVRSQLAMRLSTISRAATA